MKKLKFLTLIFAAAFLFLGGCGLNVKNEVADNISDIRYSMFEGVNQNFNATLMCGMRENPYEYDGISNQKTQFGVIAVVFNQIKQENQIAYKLIIDGAESNGYLEENPFDRSFMTDIGKIIDTTSSVQLLLDGEIDPIVLTPISADWQIDYTKALEIALTTLEADLKPFFNNKQFAAECYLKIIHDQKNMGSPYYWYFGVIGQNGQNKTLIIDVHSGEIITQK